MNIFKKKQTENLEENQEPQTEDVADDGNIIEQVTSEDAQAKDDLPSVNKAGRDGGNTKTFKMVAISVVGLIIMLVGTSLTVGKYHKSKEQKEAQEAEEIANNQKEVTESHKVDIKAEQDAMSSMYDVMPPPADAQLTENTEVAEPQPVVTPRPQYNDYSDNSMTAGRDYVPPAPITPVAPPISSFDDSEDDETPPTIVQAPVEPSSVLVDVYGAKTATSTQSETGLASTLKSSQIANGSASLRGDTTLLLSRGTTIPCVLKTKIDSTYQGFATCHLAKDVYSANGKVLLMERGSTVFGEQNVQITQGKARVSILWSKIETPKGVSVALDSPATGQLGEMGVGAKVNNHFWKRFGGAIMLSLIQDGISAGASHLEAKSDGDTTTIDNTSSTAESLAEKALENTINIPPTAIVNQGEVINIMVARDVDFSGVYKVVHR